MYQYQDQKEMRRALNSKMIIMLVGIMLVVTALTSSLSYGMRCWSMAGMADGGDKDILEALKTDRYHKRNASYLQRDLLSAGSDRGICRSLLCTAEQPSGQKCTSVEDGMGDSGCGSGSRCRIDTASYDECNYDCF